MEKVLTQLGVSLIKKRIKKMCPEKPETNDNGMYHCPYCGIMVIGGVEHIPPTEWDYKNLPDVPRFWEKEECINDEEMFGVDK